MSEDKGFWRSIFPNEWRVDLEDASFLIYEDNKRFFVKYKFFSTEQTEDNYWLGFTTYHWRYSLFGDARRGALWIYNNREKLKPRPEGL